MSRTSKPYHHGDLREALIAAGTRLLHEMGAKALTLRACAREAGVSHAAPHHHFENASGLLAEIAARGFESFVAKLDVESKSAAAPDAALEVMCRAYVDFALENGPVYGLMFRQDARGLESQHLQQAMRAAWSQLAAGVARVIGPDRHDEIDRHSAFVWAQVHGLSTLLLDQRLPPGLDESNLIDQTAKSVVSALRINAAR